MHGELFAIIPHGTSLVMYLFQSCLFCGVAFSPIILYLAWRYWSEVVRPDTDEHRYHSEQLRTATIALATAEDPAEGRGAIQRLLWVDHVSWTEWLDQIGITQQLSCAMLAALADPNASAAWIRLAWAYGIPPVTLELLEGETWQGPSARIALEVIRMTVLSTHDLLPGTPFVARLDLSKLEEMIRADHPPATALRYRSGDQDWQMLRWKL